jgi:hypothetical protein
MPWAQPAVEAAQAWKLLCPNGLDRPPVDGGVRFALTQLVGKCVGSQRQIELKAQLVDK